MSCDGGGEEVSSSWVGISGHLVCGSSVHFPMPSTASVRLAIVPVRLAIVPLRQLIASSRSGGWDKEMKQACLYLHAQVYTSAGQLVSALCTLNFRFVQKKCKSGWQVCSDAILLNSFQKAVCRVYVCMQRL